MRKILLFIFLFVSVFLGAQGRRERASSIRSVAVELTPGDTSMNDLNPLHAKIGQARMVMLGNDLTGVYQTELSRLRLVKFLHEEMDFDVLLFDLPVYEMQQASSKIDSFSWEKFPLPYYSTQSVVYDKLKKYIQQQSKTNSRLDIAGIDCTTPSATKFPGYRNTITGWADSTGLRSDPGRRDTFINTFDFFLGKRSISPTYTELKVYINVLDELQKRFSNAAQRNSFDKNSAMNAIIVQSLQSYSEYYYYRNISSSVSDSSVFYRCTVQNGSNILWMMQHLYPGKKIMIWCDGRQALRSWNPKKENIYQISIADMLSASKSNQFYSILFSGGSGKYAVDRPPRNKKRNLSRKNELAADFERTKLFCFFFESAKAPQWMKQPLRASFTRNEKTTIWPEACDAIIFTRISNPQPRVQNPSP